MGMTGAPWRRIAASASALCAVALLAGCGLRIPTDPEGTLDQATGATLRVGLSAEAGIVDVSGEYPTGPLVDVAEGFARSIDARPEWTIGSEETLVTALEEGELDLVLGGMTSATPWSDRAAISRDLRGVTGIDDRDLVVLVPLGENAMLSAVESFIDRERAGA